MALVKTEPGCPVEAELTESVIARVRIALGRGNWEEALASVAWGRDCEAEQKRPATRYDPIESLGLDTRICSALRRGGFDTIDDLLRRGSWATVGGIKQVSVETVEAVSRALLLSGFGPLTGCFRDLAATKRASALGHQRKWRSKSEKI